jgi:hypothetical protein
MLEVPRPFPLWSKASVIGEGTGRRQPMNFPVVPEDDMSRKYANESTDPLMGRLGAERRRTAKAARISRSAVKSSCAGEWGAWDQLSDDGPGQHNPDRSEGPWGKAALAA